MRASPELLKNCAAELKRQPCRTGKALLQECLTALGGYEQMIDECNYYQHIMARLDECTRRLQNWYDAKQRERTERVGKQSDD